jgi:DNA polymerase elongation subunit (family B)
MDHDLQIRGKGTTEGIVAVEATGDGEVTRYRRDPETGELFTDTDDFFPFIWVETAEQVERIRRDVRGVAGSEQMAGDLERQHLIAFDSMDGFFSAYSMLKSYAGEDEYLPPWSYTQTDDSQMYMMQSGETLFGGLTFEELTRMQFDIEVRTSGEMPDAYRRRNKILIITVGVNDGREWVLHVGDRDAGPLVPCRNERHMIRRFIRLVEEVDPDVMSGHNVHDFDFDYIRKRCDLLGIDFSVGRDGSEPRHYEAVKRAANRYLDYEAHVVHGRHVLDTMFMAYDWNQYARELDKFGLKDVAKTLGVAAGGDGEEGRTYLDMSDTAGLWDDPGSRKKFLDYALDDVKETRAIEEELSAALFQKSKIVPLGLGTLNECGTGREIEGLMMREYIRQRHSVPRSQEKGDYEGAFTELYQQGVYGVKEDTVVYNYDVASLYPYCQMGFNCFPKSDHLGVMKGMLSSLTEMRIDVKEEMRSLPDSDPRKSALDAEQDTYKVLINSFYGVEGASNFLWNDMEEAAEIVRHGRRVLRRMNTLIAEQGHTLIECDTDGSWALNDGDGLEGDALAEHITEEMPPFIDIDVDAALDGMAMYRRKNYAKQPESGGDVSFKGSAMTSSMFEKFGREFIQQGFEMMLEGQMEELHDLYMTYCERIEQKDIPVEKLVKRETLRESVEEYKEKLHSEEHGRTRDARYELVQEYDYLQASSGETIVYYNSGDLTSTPVYEAAKPIQEYDNDENVKYYIRKRMVQFATKFEPFFSEDDYKLMFPRPDRGELLPDRQDVSGVMLLQRQVNEPQMFREDLV